MLGKTPTEPLRCFTITSCLEMRRCASNGAEVVERMVGLEVVCNPEPLGCLLDFASIYMDPAASNPRPDASTIKRQRSLKMCRGGRQVMCQGEGRGQHRHCQ